VRIALWPIITSEMKQLNRRFVANVTARFPITYQKL
jgi:hypothetical protein